MPLVTNKTSKAIGVGPWILHPGESRTFAQNVAGCFINRGATLGTLAPKAEAAPSPKVTKKVSKKKASKKA